jgi:hypothetical protein
VLENAEARFDRTAQYITVSEKLEIKNSFAKLRELLLSYGAVFTLPVPHRRSSRICSPRHEGME